jgi:hypothetical protein
LNGPKRAGRLGLAPGTPLPEWRLFSGGSRLRALNYTDCLGWGPPPFLAAFGAVEVLTASPLRGRKTVTEVVQLSLRGADVRALVVHVVMRGASATPYKSGRPARPP